MQKNLENEFENNKRCVNFQKYLNIKINIDLKNTIEVKKKCIKKR